MELKTIEEKVSAIMRGDKIEFLGARSEEWKTAQSPSEWSIGVIHNLRLRISPGCADFKIDDPVMCSPDGQNWEKRHFAGFYENLRPIVFANGTTSFTSNGNAFAVACCRRPTPEEMK